MATGRLNALQLLSQILLFMGLLELLLKLLNLFYYYFIKYLYGHCTKQIVMNDTYARNTHKA